MKTDFVKPSLPFVVERPSLQKLPLLANPSAKLRILLSLCRNFAMSMLFLVAAKFVEASLPFRANSIPINQHLATGRPHKAKGIELRNTVCGETPVVPLSSHRVYEAPKLWILRTI